MINIKNRLLPVVSAFKTRQNCGLIHSTNKPNGTEPKVLKMNLLELSSTPLCLDSTWRTKIKSKYWTRRGVTKSGP